MVRTKSGHPVVGVAAHPFTEMETSIEKIRQDNRMKHLAEAIQDYGEVMRELGQRESALNAESETKHKEVLKKDLEKVAVRVAQAKYELLRARAKGGGTLVEWDKDWSDKFFKMVDPPKEQS